MSLRIDNVVKGNIIFHDHPGEDVKGGVVGGVTPVDSVAFDVLYTETGSEPQGSLFYNSTDGTLDLVLNGVNLHLGQQLYFYGKAQGAITKGALVQFAGVQGSHILIKECVVAEIQANPTYLIGVASESLANNNFGYVTYFGFVNNVYTNTPDNGDNANWVAGDILYFSNTTGGLTKTLPTKPDTEIEVAVVVKIQTGASQTGRILVRPTIYHKLGELSDVDTTSIADGNVLVWDNANSKWVAGKADDITDFDTEVSNNTDVSANTLARHDAVTVTDSSEIDFTLTGQDITASIIASSIDESKLDASVNASLDLADSALQKITHYKEGANLVYVSSTQIFVTAGELELNGKMLSNTTDSAKLDISVASDYIGGSSQRNTNKWLYVYAKDNGNGTFSTLLYDKSPLYPTCSETTIFNARINDNSIAQGDVTFGYDTDTGESNVKTGDIVRVWTDSTYETIRAGLIVSSINTGANTITFNANKQTLVDNDYIMIVNGEPRYRKVSNVWYRCIGGIRLNATGSGEIFKFFRTGNLTIFDDVSTPYMVAVGTSTSFTIVNSNNWIPPFSLYAYLFLFGFRAGSQPCVVRARECGSNAASGSIFAGAGTYATATGFVKLNPSQECEYKVDSVGDNAFLFISGYLDNL